MLAVSWVVAFFSFATCVLSLKMDLAPKERNVTQGQTRKFKYQPANDTPTNVTVLDTLDNKTTTIINGAKGGHFNWTVPDDLEVRGGYFFQLKQYVNNATITASSDSEFQILEKPKPKPETSNTTASSSGTTSRWIETGELASLSGVAALGVLILQNI